jgi:hypothetical protein
VLVPLVQILECAGNTALDGGFLNSPDGWYCRMSAPIDFESSCQTLLTCLLVLNCWRVEMRLCIRLGGAS